ncbi:hypothetical protein MA5S0422_5453 [Mycobacteroides abscessus 5S-0422]|uniref:Uncharacterized protein n=1 Tax=Mycobacteroides abscessus subsp. bolletii 1513 TaxID=1299321 RepID=X8DK92_9MYCO|nr:hypothetical protein MMAS_47090 [Mycobacteroides abscessus subsp. massiliense CCUG 48898 = JCM 15300]EIU04849.1 hypothetical protein MA5S0422_5453 [Mycobacteroides abscessus 5S-0422]EIU06090.1 hypothetical protein MA5S0421_4512 [Mycobacteroides abscessus 5S-0421]EIU09848.1 hypothetical protein MA5S0304_4277 [Mycobacteroides abscessus 5S-0304]EIU21863.1 hypothetical protein MA5S0708_4205 [Mycobacteroides abscessus 5S-0708]EIU23085.1 hypothetical protein MA5S0817_3826 [Mycobacteroides abscess
MFTIAFNGGDIGVGLPVQWYGNPAGWPHLSLRGERSVSPRLLAEPQHGFV